MNIPLSIPVKIFPEGEVFIAYAPTLDLSTVGKTKEDAKRMFAEAVEGFFEELEEMNKV